MAQNAEATEVVLGACPNCRFTTEIGMVQCASGLGGANFYVRCGACLMRGPVEPFISDASSEWNKLSDLRAVLEAVEGIAKAALSAPERDAETQ